MPPDKVLENRVRRAAARQGYRLVKSRRRDSRAVDFGTYMLVSAQSNNVEVWGQQSGYGLSLDEIGEALHIDFDPAEEIHKLNHELDENAGLARARFHELIEKWDLGSISNELDDLLKGLREPDHPKTALAFGHSLVAFLNEFRK